MKPIQLHLIVESTLLIEGRLLDKIFVPLRHCTE